MMLLLIYNLEDSEVKKFEHKTFHRVSNMYKLHNFYKLYNPICFSDSNGIKHNIHAGVNYGYCQNGITAIELVESGSTLCILNAHKSDITAFDISSDLSFIVSRSESDNIIYIWSIRPIIDKLLSDNTSHRRSNIYF